jgi:hypothetical protein
MAKRNLPQPCEIDKIRFEDSFMGSSLRIVQIVLDRRERGEVCSWTG